MLADVLLAKGDRDEAEAACRDALRLDPKNFWAHTGLGEVLLSKGDPTGAVLACREAVRIQPLTPKSHALLGIALWQTGDLPGARDALTEATRLDEKWLLALAKLPPLAVAPPPRPAARP